jgi:hypothetical protein
MGRTYCYSRLGEISDALFCQGASRAPIRRENVAGIEYQWTVRRVRAQVYAFAPMPG